MDSSFNNPGAPPTGNGDVAPVSPATVRFRSCRWRKAPEDGIAEHCTHRDVLPMAGIAGFVPDSWCADCSLYKAKRTPKKRQEETPQDNSWRRW